MPSSQVDELQRPTELLRFLFLHQIHFPTHVQGDDLGLDGLAEAGQHRCTKLPAQYMTSIQGQRTAVSESAWTKPAAHAPDGAEG